MEYCFQQSRIPNDELLDASIAVQQARRVVALTGAGISRASGLPLLDEEVQGQSLEKLFDPDFLRSDVLAYYRFYAKILSDWRSVPPNDAHRALADAGVWVITLNVDGLHRDAGTVRLIEMHGNLRELRCHHCQGIYGTNLVERGLPPRCPNCSNVLHPGVCLQGDEVRHYSRAMDWVGQAEVLLVIGTSLRDEPANRFPTVALGNGATVIRIDNDADGLVPVLFGKQKVHPQGVHSSSML